MLRAVGLTESPLGLPAIIGAVNGLIMFTVLRWEWATGEEVAALMLFLNPFVTLIWMLAAPWLQSRYKKVEVEE